MDRAIYHIGTPRHSGRYPWGSGGKPQRSKNFAGYVNEMRKTGLSDIKIAASLGMTTTALRREITLSTNETRLGIYTEVIKLKEKGYSDSAIGRKLEIAESSVRSYLDPIKKERMMLVNNTANILRDNVNKKGFIDVGTGVELQPQLQVSRTTLSTALYSLEKEGYTIHKFSEDQAGTGKKTTNIILCPHGTKYSDVIYNKDKIQVITDYSEDGGKTFSDKEPIKSLNSKRVSIRYAEDGGAQQDGAIELRRGIDDISLGNKHYAQVRIGIDGTHYMKGMAFYSDDIPEGYDIVYNTSKKKGTPIKGTKDGVYKSMEQNKETGKIIEDDPFGASYHQKHYVDKNGNKQLSVLNRVGTKEDSGEEGAWDDWSKRLSSQFLSKQPPELAKKQLKMKYDLKQEEFEEIMAYTNPAVRKKLLKSFSDDCDAEAGHLRAAALPRQRNQVLLPLTKMKDNEVYAPNFDNGEEVVLIRHPHGGIFEIPELKVNNRNLQGKQRIGNSRDAVGLNYKVAQKLSGADFDGDTVIVIPNPKKLGIKTHPSLEELKDFDPKVAYPYRDGITLMTKKNKDNYMGSISNLITDMTIKGAGFDEIAKAVRHSMVVIDAEKHRLDFKKSYTDNNIATLKARYQGGANKGASTIISKAKSERFVDQVKEGVSVVNPKTGKSKIIYIDPKTGKKLYTKTGETYINKEGKVIKRQTKTTAMAQVEDAFELSSGYPKSKGHLVEVVYAEHANRLKALANTARKEYLNTPPAKMNASATKAYFKEVAALKSYLNIAKRNKPLERHAQRQTNIIVRATKNAKDLDRNDIKKLKGKTITMQRTRFGAKKELIPITERMWEAIQAGAISNSLLTSILDNTNMDVIKQYATPRTKKGLTATKEQRAKFMLSKGYTRAEVANQLGVSESLLDQIGD